MEKMDYGVKAPTLDDGSLLLQELKLTPEQTEQVKLDRSLMMRASKDKIISSFVTGFFENALLILTLYLSITLLFNDKEDNLATSALPVFFLIVSWMLGSHRKKAVYRLTARLSEIVDESKVAPHITQVFKRYMPGNKANQTHAYVQLVILRDHAIGGDESYRVRLDTSDKEEHVVREVMFPKAA